MAAAFAAAPVLALLFGALGAAVLRRAIHREKADLGELVWRYVLRPFGRLRLRALRRLRGPGGVLYVAPGGGQPRLLKTPPERPDGTVRCVCVSDTHLLHRELRLPAGDLLLHGGDALLGSREADSESLAQFGDFAAWLAAQPHTHKVLIGGNHDGALAALGAEAVQRLLPGIMYLQDRSVQLAGLHIYGSPLSVGASKNCAFQPQSGYDEDAAVAGIPAAVDILLTHGPPGGSREALGRASPALAARVKASRPRYHVFGHYHLGYGATRSSYDAECWLINASSADAFFAVTHPPVVLDIQPRSSARER